MLGLTSLANTAREEHEIDQRTIQGMSILDCLTDTCNTQNTIYRLADLDLELM